MTPYPVDVRCRNDKCPYLAHTPDGYCCGACANAAVVGDGGYALHSDATCARQRLNTGHGGLEWSPRGEEGGNILGGCLAIVIALVVVAVILFGGAAYFGGAR